MVSISDENELMRVRAGVAKIELRTRSYKHSYWIGANDLTREGDWEWIDGSPMTFKNFRGGEPGREDCGSLWSSDSKFSDVACGTKMFYICKRLN